MDRILGWTPGGENVILWEDMTGMPMRMNPSGNLSEMPFAGLKKNDYFLHSEH